MSNRASNTNLASSGQLTAVLGGESNPVAPVWLRSSGLRASETRTLDVDVPPKIG